jgi:hypothetical protein
MSTHLTRSQLETIKPENLAEQIRLAFAGQIKTFSPISLPLFSGTINLLPLAQELENRVKEEFQPNRLDPMDRSILESEDQAIYVHSLEIAKMYLEQIAVDEEW